MISFRSTIFIGLSCLFLWACSEDTPLPPVEGGDTGRAQLQQLMQQGSLLTGFRGEDDIYTLYFETDTVGIGKEQIKEIATTHEGWNTQITFFDGQTLDVPSLGEHFSLSDEQIQLNPSGYAPLSALLTVSFPVKGRLHVCVKGKKGKATDLSYTFKKYGYNHQEYIHGLYMNSENTVYVSLTDSLGNIRLTDSLKVVTPDQMLHSKLPELLTVVSEPEKMEPGVTLINHLGDNEYDTHRPFIIDAAGDVRWLLWMKDHPDLTITAHTGLKRMHTGNFFCGDVKTGRIVEFDMVGNLIHSWDLRPWGYTFHHDVIELPNGHFVATASKDDSQNEHGIATVNDYIIEFDPEANAVINEWDLKWSLDPSRTAVIPPSEMKDAESNWGHANGLCYSESDDCLIVSLRNQGVFKLDFRNRLKWGLAVHKGWNNSVAGALLSPLDASGQWINDEAVKSGQKPHPDFEYVWGAHCPTLMPNGHLLVFDNGLCRHFYEYGFYNSYRGPDPATGEHAYSRAVEYEIDEDRRSIREVWQYGHERYRDCYAGGVSSVQYLPGSNHVLFAPGLATINKNGLGGKVIEVDYQTKEVVYEVHVSVPALLAGHST